jgi:hypothetical protein
MIKNLSQISEYDDRQLRLMLSSISEYEAGKIALGHLVSNLEALQLTLEGQDLEFKAKFEPLWGKLEDTYAMMLYEERTAINDIDHQLITESLAELKPLISSRLTPGN